MSEPENKSTGLMASVKPMPGKAAKLEVSPNLKDGRQSIEDLWGVAQVLYQSGLVPQAFEDSKAVMYALAMGQDLGFTNTQALASITVINGKPSVYADGLPAILHRSGHFFIEEFSGTIEDETYTASVTIERKDTGSVITREFSVAMAKRAGLWQTEAIIKKEGQYGPYEKPNDSPWYKYPERMIWRRAIGWAVRDGLADEMYGVQIVEEQADHLKTIRDGAEPKTSKFASKVKAMGEDEADYIAIDIEEDIDEDTPPGEKALADAEPELAKQVNQLEEEEAEEALFSEDPSDEKPSLPSTADAESDPDAGEGTPPAVEDLAFDSSGRKLPGLALDWFDYLLSATFDVHTFEKDLADEMAQKWFKELEDDDKAYILEESRRLTKEDREAI